MSGVRGDGGGTKTKDEPSNRRWRRDGRDESRNEDEGHDVDRASDEWTRGRSVKTRHAVIVQFGFSIRAKFAGWLLCRMLVCTTAGTSRIGITGYIPHIFRPVIHLPVIHLPVIHLPFCLSPAHLHGLSSLACLPPPPDSLILPFFPSPLLASIGLSAPLLHNSLQ